jgi:hypothetical protein
MSDGRRKTATMRAALPGKESSKLGDRTLAQSAVPGGEAARPARIKDEHARQRLPFARPPLLGAPPLVAWAAALLLLTAEGGAGMAQEPEIARNTPTLVARGTSSFVSIDRPTALFALDSAELAKAGESHDAVRARTGDGREDSLTFGAAARSDAPFMELAVYRIGSEASDPAPFFVELSRRAAAAGLAVSKATPADPMRSKFGDLESADVKLSLNGVERSCVAFRRAVPGETLQLGGWYCPPAGSFAERAELSCIIDRLEPSNANEDRTTREGFAKAEDRRLGCGRPPVLTASALAAPPVQTVDPPRRHGTKARRRRIP